MYNELMHYGIKGQKWGVRRFQNKDGTLTAKGKKRYSEFTTSHREVIEKQYRDKGLTKDEAKIAADKRIKIEKTVAAAAGVTVAACAAYYAKNKYVETYCDQTLKAGTTFHNLDKIANPRPGEHLYVTYRQNDENFFRGHFALGKLRQTGHVFNHTITATDDVKIPSLKTRESVFKQLYDNDPEFAEVFRKHSRTNKQGATAKQVYKAMWSKFGDKDNKAFNEQKAKYFKALQQKGYEAIVDEWDTTPGVFRSDAPLILLNNQSKSMGEMTIKELTSRDILLAQANSKHYRTKTGLLNLANLPHTNHFTESEKYLSRYAAKSSKNMERIDKVIGELDDNTVKNLVKREKGKILVDAAKYMERNKNLSVKEAFEKAKRADEIKDGVTAMAALTSASTAASVASMTITDITARNRVRKYIHKHPNTRLTYAQLLKKERQKLKKNRK